MGLFERRRCQKFLEAVQNFEENNPKTHSGIKLNAPAKEMLAKYELEDNTIDFIVHAVVLYTNDNFLNRPAIDLIRKIQLYMDSMGKNPSPFIYPIFGLGGIPEGFSRISAVNGGTLILMKFSSKMVKLLELKDLKELPNATHLFVTQPMCEIVDSRTELNLLKKSLELFAFLIILFLAQKIFLLSKLFFLKDNSAERMVFCL